MWLGTHIWSLCIIKNASNGGRILYIQRPSACWTGPCCSKFVTMNKNYILESRFTCAGCPESLGKALWEDRVLDSSVHCLPLSLVEPLVHSGQLRQVHLGGQPLCIIVSLCPCGKVPHDLLDSCFDHSFTKTVVDIPVCGWCVSHETVTIFCNCDLTALSLHYKFDRRREIISTCLTCRA